MAVSRPRTKCRCQTAPLQPPLVEEDPALPVMPQPRERSIGPLLADPIELAPPFAQALVPKSGDLRDDLAAVPLPAGLVGFVSAPRAVPDQAGIDTGRGERAPGREPALGTQVLPVLAHRVARPGNA
jgi:hypothetical protein